MRNITKEVNIQDKTLEFIWGQPQAQLVVFKNGEYFKSFELKENSLEEALKTARGLSVHRRIFAQ